MSTHPHATPATGNVAGSTNMREIVTGAQDNLTNVRLVPPRPVWAWAFVIIS